MVAIGVIMAAVFGASTLIITSITTGRVSQNRVEAANFAREGIEIVRSMRDSNWLKFEQNEKVEVPVGSGTFVIPSWKTGLAVKSYIISYDTTLFPQWTLIPCSNNPCSDSQKTIFKVVNATQVIYTQSSSVPANSSPTKYRRDIKLEQKNEGAAPVSLSNVEYLIVTSTVTWNDRTGAKSLVAQTRLYDWK